MVGGLEFGVEVAHEFVEVGDFGVERGGELRVGEAREEGVVLGVGGGFVGFEEGEDVGDGFGE